MFVTISFNTAGDLTLSSGSLGLSLTLLTFFSFWFGTGVIVILPIFGGMYILSSLHSSGSFFLSSFSITIS
uniref:Uncharacterized protein n=1 Tax=Pararge aegeria TaxID=116150 RepID=S4NFQ7_9NEOP